MYKIAERENPMDRSQKKFYATPSYTKDVELRKIAEDISKNCTLTPADISAVLESFLDVVPNYLEEGHSIKMGNFGRFRLSFSSKGFETEEAVTADAVTRTRVLFVPGVALKKRLTQIRFEQR